MILDKSFIGQYVIVRCTEAGVHSGTLASFEGRSCVLEGARRLWLWKVKANGDFLNSLALSGVHADSKLSAEIPLIMLTENCEILVCSQEAKQSLQEHPVYNA